MRKHFYDQYVGRRTDVKINANPYWHGCHEHQPEALRVIDRSMHADVLLSHTYLHGLYLDFLETYSIWFVR